MRAVGRLSEAGQAMAEFALVLPIFVLLLVGTIDGGRMVFVNNQLSEAAREGARWGSVQGRSETSALRDVIADETKARLVGVPNVTVTVGCERRGSAVSACGTGDILSVTVESDFELVTPLLSQLMGNQTLSGTSKVMVNQ